MDTPVFDFVNEYKSTKYIRLHMPGHKGDGFLSEEYDITEIFGADSLFEASGIIKKSEENATSLFKTKKTIYSTQGSTSVIFTMLALVTQRSGVEKPLVVAARNAHKAFINACILLDIEVTWVFPEYDNTIVSGEYSHKDIEKAISASGRKPCAIYITSPDYIGRTADISAISAVCKTYNIPLLVDNAHGAYLNFLDENSHPIHSGATMCCDSAHKTLPVLTSGAYLHIAENTDDYYCENAKDTMALFSSTSPSYLTLSSLDLCNKYLNDKIKDDLDLVIPLISKLKSTLTKNGYTICGDEPLKLSLFTIPYGYYGYEIASILRKNKIECEYADATHIVLLFSSKNTVLEIEATKTVLMAIPKKTACLQIPEFKLSPPKKSMAARKAALCSSEEINVDVADGRICSKIIVACPPGIPVIVSGEVFNTQVIKILKNYGILTVNVVKL